MGRLDDRVILITGAAKGQGAAETRLARGEGAIVYAADVADDLGQETADAAGATYVHLDVTSAANWRQVVDTILAEHGRIDGLVNNAGIFAHAGVLDSDEETYKRIIDVNQNGVYLGMSVVSPKMAERKSGSIVNISSVAGMRGHLSIAYVGSKWAVRGMTKSAARQLAVHNVRVNSVHPGAIETDMLFGLGEETVDRLSHAIPMRRTASAEELGASVMFLLSDEASYVTGAELVVDGGMIL